MLSVLAVPGRVGWGDTAAQLLIKAGATLSPFTYKDRQTALLLACTHSSGMQHTEVTKALLAAGAAVEYGGQADMTPLITATHYGNVAIVRFIVLLLAQK